MNKVCVFLFALFFVLTLCTSCGGGGGGGGGGTAYEPAGSDMRNGGTGGWGGANGTNNTNGSGVTLYGGTTLDVEYYEYNGQRYETAQELLDIIGPDQSITGTIEIPVHVRSDNSNRKALYVVNGNERTLKHPYKIKIKNTKNELIYSNETEYFYSSIGFPLSKLPDEGATEIICSRPFTFTSETWEITAASGEKVTIAKNGNLTDILKENAEFMARPVPVEKYIYQSGTLVFSSSCNNNENFILPTLSGNITEICIPNDKRISIDLTNNIIESDSVIDTFSGILINSDCRESITSIVMPNNITQISAFAFQNCHNLTSVNIPINVTSIGESAFENCKNLLGIAIPENLIWLDSKAFKDCERLSNVTLPTNVFFETIFESTFENCKSLTNITIPGNIISIKDSAFKGCSQLSIVNIQSGVGTIEASVFNDCTSLTAITLPATLSIAGETAGGGSSAVQDGPFNGCTNLVSITFETGCSITAIQKNFAKGCTKLTTINNLPANINQIKESAFDGCSLLTLTALPTALTTVDNRAFYNCASCSFTVTNTVEIIGAYAFAGSGVTSVIICDSVLIIPEGAFKDCTNLLTATLGTNTYEIQKDAFNGCSLLNNVDVSNINTIGEKAFYGCTNLGISTAPGYTPGQLCLNAATTIEAEAYKGCSTITEIEFESITSIGNDAFSQLSPLGVTVYFLNPSVGPSDVSYGNNTVFATGTTAETDSGPTLYWDTSTGSFEP